MTDQDVFISDLFMSGQAAVVTGTTGTTCPCTVERGTYSAEWHRLYPSAANCNGTKLINTTPVTFHIKARFMPLKAAVNTLLESKDLKSIIGDIKKDDLAMIGAVNLADCSFFNLNIINLELFKVTPSVYNYACYIKHFYDLTTDGLIGQLAFLRRSE